MIAITPSGAVPFLRRERTRLRSARLSAEAQRGESHAEAATVTFLPRHRLSDDAMTGAEALCLRQAGRQPPPGALMAWFLQRDAGERLAIALPEEMLRADRLVGAVGGALAGAGLPGSRLELILSEAMLVAIDADGLLALSALRDLGVGLCVDAFGAGMSSLTLLRRLPLTAIKLARTLVRGLPADREDAAIARAAIATAQTMDLAVIADGVESEHQRAFLAHCGCDEGQGPLFGPPLRLSGPRLAVSA